MRKSMAKIKIWLGQNDNPESRLGVRKLTTSLAIEYGAANL